MSRKCKDCLFWKESSEIEAYGECRIRAPLRIMADDNHRRVAEDTYPSDDGKSDDYLPSEYTGSIRVWPLTHEGDWCGEGQSR